MSTVDLSKKIDGYLKPAASKAKKFEDTVAVSISLISENDEDLYVAVREGKILVAPYAYDDNGCAIEAAPEFVDKIFSGALSLAEALEKGYVKVKSGDVAKFKALEVLVSAKKSEKSAAKKPAAKKAAAKAPAKKAAPAKASEKPAAPAKVAAPVAAKPVAPVKPAAPVAVKPATPAKPAEKPAVPAVKAPAASNAPAAKTPAKNAAKKK